MAAPELLDLLRARSGIICTVGAGGKKTTLYRLLEAHPGPVALTSTVFIPPFPKGLPLTIVRAPTTDLLDAVASAADTQSRIAYTGTTTKKGRFEGVPPALVEEIHQRLGFAATFVKADGARTRLIKAPADDEPQLPASVTTVIPVVSAHALGQPLTDRIAHRPDRIAQVTGARLGEVLTPSHLARLFSSDQGLLKAVGQADVVPVINMVDTEELRALATDTARKALRLTDRFEYVVLAAMRDREPEPFVVRR